MAKEIVRSGKKELAVRGKALQQAAESAPKKHAKKAAKKHAAKDAGKKHAGKKQAKKTTESLDKKDLGQHGLRAAFHHMQRASVVISLMEKGTGEDLRDLLERGVKLYRRAAEDRDHEGRLLRAVGVLRAAEHLALAGLYAARAKHRQKVADPAEKWLKEFIAATDGRLDKVEGGSRGKGPDLYPVSVELLRQAEDAEDDPHLAYELAMAADGLCLALENGL